MKDSRPVLLLFLPMISELHRSPVSNVTVFSFAKHSVQHSRRTQQTHMPAVQRRERSAANVSRFRKQHTAGLPIGCRTEQQVFDFVEGNPGMVQHDRTRGRK